MAVSETRRIYDASDSARVRRVGSRLTGALARLEREAQDAADLGELETALLLRLTAREVDARFADHLRRVAASEA